MRTVARVFLLIAVLAAPASAEPVLETAGEPTSTSVQPAEPRESGTELNGLEAMTRDATARLEKANASPEARGTGPYPAMAEVDLAFPDATLYHPADLAALGERKLGLLIWGNGACSNDGASARAHLAEIASHGYLAIAPGQPLTAPSTLPGGPSTQLMVTTVQDLRRALDWALAENDRRGSPYFQRIDPGQIAVAGHSCGGMQAIIVGDDPRVKTVIVHNSGVTSGDYVLSANPPLVMHERRIEGLRRPVLIVMGGESDVLWKSGNNLYARLPGPGAFVSADVGHGGTFDQPHGGQAASLAVDWLEWQLRGDRKAAATFVGQKCGICEKPGWTVKTKGLK